MEGLYMPADAEGIIAAEVAELAAKLEGAGVVNVSHVPLHVRLVHAFIRTKGAGELRVARIHFASELYMPLQQALRRVYFLAIRAHVSLVHMMRRIVIRVVTQVPAAGAGA